jgi:anti-anti-sigma factor
VSELGIKERRVGSITILDAVPRLRIALRFGRSSVTLTEATLALLANGQRKILLNLDGRNVIGARELGELVSTYLMVTKGGGEFKLFNLTPTTRQLMLTTNLSSVLDLYDTEAKALESFKERQTDEFRLSQVLPNESQRGEA